MEAGMISIRRMQWTAKREVIGCRKR